MITLPRLRKTFRRALAGALAASFYSTQKQLDRVISFDMGGTTAKICLIDHGQPLLTTDFEAARVYRFKKGSGLPLKVPVIEMIEIIYKIGIPIFALAKA